MKEEKNPGGTEREARRLFLEGIAEENRRLIAAGRYEADGTVYDFGRPEEIARAECMAPDRTADVHEAERRKISGRRAEFRFLDGESFDAPSECVLNFANGKTPGGGYLYGSSSQEEALCRESTLYASLSSPAAAGMYRYNKRYDFPEGSDFFVFSPHVEIFRRNFDGGHVLFGPPRVTSVITAPAIDMRGEARLFPASEIERVMMQRIRFLLTAASSHGCRSITLGAWGCGVFGHAPRDVARYFFRILLEERYESLFDTVLFAIYSPNDPSYGEAFRRTCEEVRQSL